jgi:hypothetical protein
MTRIETALAHDLVGVNDSVNDIARWLRAKGLDLK